MTIIYYVQKYETFWFTKKVKIEGILLGGREHQERWNIAPLQQHNMPQLAAIFEWGTFMQWSHWETETLIKLCEKLT